MDITDHNVSSQVGALVSQEAQKMVGYGMGLSMRCTGRQRCLNAALGQDMRFGTRMRKSREMASFSPALSSHRSAKQ